MAWLAIDKDGTERICVVKPHRVAGEYWMGFIPMKLPKGSIKKLIGRELTWKDEPVELKDE